MCSKIKFEVEVTTYPHNKILSVQNTVAQIVRSVNEFAKRHDVADPADVPPLRDCGMSRYYRSRQGVTAGGAPPLI